MAKKFVKSYDNFLEVDLINQIENYAQQCSAQTVWGSSHAWEFRVKRFTTPISVLILPDKFSIPIQNQLLKKTSLTWKKNNPPLKSMYYLWPPGGYIGWHDDGKYEFASMIYLNPTWNMEWGGFFIHEDSKGQGFRAEAPAFNKCLINEGGVPHTVSRLTPDAPLRRIILTFGPVLSKVSYRIAAEKKWREWRLKHKMDYVPSQSLNER